MAAADVIHTFSEKTRREIGEMLADWRHWRETRTGPVGPDRQPQGVHVRWARTGVDGDNGIYPTPPANKFVVIFGSIEYDDTASGQETVSFEEDDPVVSRVALSRVGWLPQDTEVQVTLCNGRWYILDDRFLIRKATANAGITAGSSGTVTVYSAGAATTFQPTAHLDWLHNGRNVASGDELLIRWFADQTRWVIIEAECT